MTPQQALERLKARCSKGEMCSGQVRKKLQEWSLKNVQAGKDSFPDNEIASILEILIREKYVDDARFAEAYVRDKARFSRWGRNKISYNLRMMGLPSGIISSAMENNMELFSDDVLEQLVRRKWDSLKAGDSLEAKRAKVLRFALGRGFGYDQILPVIKRLG